MHDTNERQIIIDFDIRNIPLKEQARQLLYSLKRFLNDCIAWYVMQCHAMQGTNEHQVIIDFDIRNIPLK